MLGGSSKADKRVNGNLVTQIMIMVGFVPIIVMTIVHVIVSSDIFYLPVIAFWIIPLVVMVGFLLAALLALMDNGMCADMFGEWDLSETQQKKLLLRDRGSSITIAVINTVVTALVFLGWIGYWVSNENVNASDTEGITQYHETAYGWLNAMSAALYGIGSVSYPLVIYTAYVRNSALQMANVAATGKSLV